MWVLVCCRHLWSRGFISSFILNPSRQQLAVCRSYRVACGRARSLCWKRLGLWLLRSPPPSNPLMLLWLRCWVGKLITSETITFKSDVCMAWTPVGEDENNVSHANKLVSLFSAALLDCCQLASVTANFKPHSILRYFLPSDSSIDGCRCCGSQEGSLPDGSSCSAAEGAGSTVQ